MEYCVSAEKEKAEKLAAEEKARASKFEAELNALRREQERARKLEAELDALRKEREDRRAEEEAALQARNLIASRLRSVASDLAGECFTSFAFHVRPNVVC